MKKSYEIKETVCFTCAHLMEYPKCRAFPKGIPYSIRSGENDHTKAVAGDNGYRYESILKED